MRERLEAIRQVLPAAQQQRGPSRRGVQGEALARPTPKVEASWHSWPSHPVRTAIVVTGQNTKPWGNHRRVGGQECQGRDIPSPRVSSGKKGKKRLLFPSPFISRLDRWYDAFFASIAVKAS
jgi:hypothetical protein